MTKFQVGHNEEDHHNNNDSSFSNKNGSYSQPSKKIEIEKVEDDFVT